MQEEKSSTPVVGNKRPRSASKSSRGKKSYHRKSKMPLLWKVWMINELLQSRTESARQRSSVGERALALAAKLLGKVTTFEKRPKLLWFFSCRKTLLFCPIRTLLAAKQEGFVGKAFWGFGVGNFVDSTLYADFATDQTLLGFLQRTSCLKFLEWPNHLSNSWYAVRCVLWFERLHPLASKKAY